MFWTKKPREVVVSISKESCVGCVRCVDKCKRGALKMHYNEDKGNAWMAYPEKCSGCGKCAKVCRFDAITIVSMNGTLVEAFK